MTTLNGKSVINIELDINTKDAPDFCDSYITYAEYEDGSELTEKEIDELNNDSDLVYGLVVERLY